MRNFRHNWLNLARGTISFIIKRRSGWPVPAVAATVAVGRIIIRYFYYRYYFQPAGGQVDYYSGRSFSIHFSLRTLSSHQRPRQVLKGPSQAIRGYLQAPRGRGLELESELTVMLIVFQVVLIKIGPNGCSRCNLLQNWYVDT